jgi:hypothetical protein
VQTNERCLTCETIVARRIVIDGMRSGSVLDTHIDRAVGVQARRAPRWSRCQSS